MKNNDIETFLRDNKPQIEDRPTFLLEVQEKMRMVEGLKAEVDRQRKYGRVALVMALITGVVVGALGVLIAFLYPIDPEAISSGLLSEIRLFLDTYKQYLLLPIAICASSLGVILARQKVG